jgi:hypothetical protein
VLQLLLLVVVLPICQQFEAAQDVAKLWYLHTSFAPHASSSSSNAAHAERMHITVKPCELAAHPAARTLHMQRHQLAKTQQTPRLLLCTTHQLPVV